MKRGLTLTLLAAALAVAPAAATTVMYVPIERSIELSEMVVVGHVLRLETDYNQDGEIVTKVHLLVQEALKGSLRRGEVFVFDAWGGSLDGTTVETVGEASYRLGEKVLVQLESIDGEYHTLGLSFGKWNVVKGKDGVQSAVRSLSDLHLVGASETPVEKLPLRRLRALIKKSAN
jgi:hypothetical protein